VNDLICKNFVPLHLSVINDADRKLLWEMKPEYGCSIGYFVVSPQGKVVSFTTEAEGPKELMEFLRKALAQCGELSPPRDITKMKRTAPVDKGLGVNKEGVARLAVFVRSGELQKTYPALAMFDSIYLRPEPLASLAPPRAELGATYLIPEATARQFVRILQHTSDGSVYMHPEHLQVAKLQGEVMKISKHAIQVHVKGELAGERKVGASIPSNAKGKIEGLLTFNDKKELQGLLFLNEGRHTTAYEDFPVTGLIEWRFAQGGQGE
jgi:hypothetical protein